MTDKSDTGVLRTRLRLKSLVVPLPPLDLRRSSILLPGVEWGDHASKDGMMGRSHMMRHTCRAAAALIFFGVEHLEAVNRKLANVRTQSAALSFGKRDIETTAGRPLLKELTVARRDCGVGASDLPPKLGGIA